MKPTKLGDKIASREGATVLKLSPAAWALLASKVDLDACGLILALCESSRMIIVPRSIGALPFPELVRKLRGTVR